MSKSEINYTKNKAVALKYNPKEDLSPIVVASGYGEMAKKIIEVADENGIPIYRDDSTASLLTMLEVGRNVPPELYQVIASIYATVLSTANDLKKNYER